MDSPYYLAPQGKLATETFRVLQMKAHSGSSERIHFLEPKTERVTLLPEQIIAIIGFALMARPISRSRYGSRCPIATQAAQ